MSSQTTRTPHEGERKVTIVPVTSRRYARVTQPVDAYCRAYRELLPASDFDCILNLVKQGKVQVVIDTKHHGVSLIPDSQVEAFLDQVFGALSD